MEVSVTRCCDGGGGGVLPHDSRRVSETHDVGLMQRCQRCRAVGPTHPLQHLVNVALHSRVLTGGRLQRLIAGL